MKRFAFLTVLWIVMVGSAFTQTHQGIRFADWITIYEKGSLEEKMAALEAFGSLQIPESEQLLLEALNHENREVRLTAAWVLGSIQSANAVEPLIWMMTQENDARIDGALVNIGEEAVHWLTVRLRLATILDSVDFGLRVCRILVDIESEQGIAEVASFLSLLINSEDYRNSAMGLLRTIGEKAVRPLVAKLQTTTDPMVQSDIINTLAHIGDPQALEAVKGLIRSPYAEVRISVAYALGKIRSPNNTDHLIALLQDLDDDVKINAILSLGMLKDSRAVIYLLTSLNDSNPIVKAFSAYALGEIKDVRAVYPLITALNETAVLKMRNPKTGQWEEASVRTFAAEALRKIQDPRGLEELEKRGL